MASSPRKHRCAGSYQKHSISMTASPLTTQHHFDVLIVGSGLAGLSAALHLAPTHRVAVLTKRAMVDGSSGWAQGGIAAVLAEGDSFDAHVQDTLVAGAPVDPAPRVLWWSIRPKASIGCASWACRSRKKMADCT
jgi:NADPH-dependent 2,4-dienoyl-CoA reductase/sulfur reductase-like enzyme